LTVREKTNPSPTTHYKILKFYNSLILMFRIILFLLAAGCFGCQSNDTAAGGTAGTAAPAVDLKNQLDSASYAFGVVIGNSLKRQMDPTLNPDLLLSALTAVMKGQTPPLSVEQANQVYSVYNQKQQTQALAQQAPMQNDNFLTENKNRKEVTTTASGLQYEILKKGPGGKSPKATDMVTVHYHGTNVDGSVFDSSVQRGQPATFPLNQVIKGWTEGLQYMEVGDKFKFYIPAGLAYGDRSPSPKIKPNATLIFEVELLKIN
jgi:FKBP-type peptidyl-prolyl cis-trans isomerase FklB